MEAESRGHVACHPEVGVLHRAEWRTTRQPTQLNFCLLIQIKSRKLLKGKEWHSTTLKSIAFMRFQPPQTCFDVL